MDIITKQVYSWEQYKEWLVFYSCSEAFAYEWHNGKFYRSNNKVLLHENFEPSGDFVQECFEYGGNYYTINYGKNEVYDVWLELENVFIKVDLVECFESLFLEKGYIEEYVYSCEDYERDRADALRKEL